MSTWAFRLCSRRLYDVSPAQQHDLNPVESACRGRLRFGADTRYNPVMAGAASDRRMPLLVKHAPVTL
jgi:CO/xanthine dehydrogenase FAD-binding subunit